MTAFIFGMFAGVLLTVAIVTLMLRRAVIL